jgi:hypothetical protein
MALQSCTARAIQTLNRRRKFMEINAIPNSSISAGLSTFQHCAFTENMSCFATGSMVNELTLSSKAVVST